VPLAAAVAETGRLCKSIVGRFGIIYNSDQTYKPWFQSTRLPEGRHTITARNVGMTQIDYAIINVASQTTFSGKPLSWITKAPLFFTGHWSRNTSQFQSGYLGVVYLMAIARTVVPLQVSAYWYAGEFMKFQLKTC
jgi:hypothetical protein